MSTLTIVDFIEGPTYLAPALVNNELSGLDELDMKEYIEFMNNIPEGCYIVGIEGESYTGKYNGKITELFNYIMHKRFKR